MNPYTRRVSAIAGNLFIGCLEHFAQKLCLDGRCASCARSLGPRFMWRLVGSRAYHHHCRPASSDRRIELEEAICEHRESLDRRALGRGKPLDRDDVDNALYATVDRQRQAA